MWGLRKKFRRRDKISLLCFLNGIRHTAITTALTLNNGNIAKTARYSRHAKVETVMVYNDQRRDEAGDIAALVGESL